MSLPYPAPTRMNVLGIDFTSRPTRRKPISCLHCILEGDVLRAGDLEEWTDFDAFELVLQRPRHDGSLKRSAGHAVGRITFAMHSL
jgi:hypothetical protein